MISFQVITILVVRHFAGNSIKSEVESDNTSSEIEEDESTSAKAVQPAKMTELTVRDERVEEAVSREDTGSARSTLEGQSEQPKVDQLSISKPQPEPETPSNSLAKDLSKCLDSTSQAEANKFGDDDLESCQGHSPKPSTKVVSNEHKITSEVPAKKPWPSPTVTTKTGKKCSPESDLQGQFDSPNQQLNSVDSPLNNPKIEAERTSIQSDSDVKQQSNSPVASSLEGIPPVTKKRPHVSGECSNLPPPESISSR